MICSGNKRDTDEQKANIHSLVPEVFGISNASDVSMLFSWKDEPHLAFNF